MRVATQYAFAPLQVDNTFVFIRHVASVPACWLSKTSATTWPLTFWPWKWCSSHVWRGLPLPILVFLVLSDLELGPMYATDIQRDVRQTSDKHRLMPPLLRGRRNNNAGANYTSTSLIWFVDGLLRSQLSARGFIRAPTSLIRICWRD